MSAATDRRDIFVGKVEDLDIELDMIDTVYEELRERRQRARQMRADLQAVIDALPNSAIKTRAQTLLNRVVSRLNTPPTG